MTAPAAARDELRDKCLVEYRVTFRPRLLRALVRTVSFLVTCETVARDEYRTVRSLARQAIRDALAGPCTVERVERRTSEHAPFREVRYPVPPDVSSYLTADENVAANWRPPQVWP